MKAQQASSSSWLTKAQAVLNEAVTPWGIKASLTNQDNYGAIFTRDAVMAGIAGIFLKDSVIIKGLLNTLQNLKKTQGQQGQIASNFTITHGKISKVSYGTLSPKIDACTWYLIGIGLMKKHGYLLEESFLDSIQKTINLLDGIEYNQSNLLYVPKGGNWADEYVYDGYILYDQILRIWALQLLAQAYQRPDWAEKAKQITETIPTKYIKDDLPYFIASFFPGGSFDKFDLAAHALAGIIFSPPQEFYSKSLNWISTNFLQKSKIPPVFYPVISEDAPEWLNLKRYHIFDFKNKPHHYHNGGIWLIWLGWLAITLSLWNKKKALNLLVNEVFKYLNQTKEFEFNEYIAADDMSLNGTKQLCYTATGIIFLELAKKNFDFSSFLSPNTPLIIEDLPIKKEYFSLSKKIFKSIQKTTDLATTKTVIAICGESGSGKSVTAKCLQIELSRKNIKSVILHQDNYYKYPPKENQERRKADINWVGFNEVCLDKIQSNINNFLRGKSSLKIPIVDYENNSFSERSIDTKDHTVLIVEGVYVFLLEKLDYKIFMERTYKDTLDVRKKRNREKYDKFVEKILLIEHSLIAPMINEADILVTKEYELNENNTHL